MQSGTEVRVTNKKPTLYEILEVSPSASFAELKTAHRRLTRALLTEKLGLGREEIDAKLQVLDIAYNTLSNQTDRDAYDARLAAPNQPQSSPLAAGTSLVPQGADQTLPVIVAAIESLYGKGKAVPSEPGAPHPLAIMADTVNKSASSLWKIMRIIAGLLVLGVVISAASAILLNRQVKRPSGTISKAEEKVILQEYYQTHGVRPGSKAEMDLLEIERFRKVNEERASKLEKEKAEREYNRFLDESRREGEQVSQNLKRAEEDARRKAAWDKRQAEERQRQKESEEQEAESRRLEEARRRAGLASESQ